MASTNNNNNKRMRGDKVSIDDVLRKAREIWRRDPDKERSIQTEELEFRQFFGCGLVVFLNLWNLLTMMDFVPPGGTIEHLLWTLMFLKTYANQKVLCTLAGSVSDETFRKWTWNFVDGIVKLEDAVVSPLLAMLLSAIPTKSNRPQCCHRSFGKTD
jgi:hypothetical protein